MIMTLPALGRVTILRRFAKIMIVICFAYAVVMQPKYNDND